MSTLKNLIAGQYQIGDIVFGKGTTVNVDTFDAKPYDKNVQDMQLSRNDEINFGQDQDKPTTIEITFNVRYNWLLPKYSGLIPNFWHGQPTVDDFAREWKADEIRQIPGEVKPLYKCGRDGITRAIYGRPGQFTSGENTEAAEAVECMGEFRRLDTYGYGVTEHALIMSQADPTVTIPGTLGNAPTWLRILLVGPVTHPIITFSSSYERGETVIDFDYEVEAGEIAEISSYPWKRRVINDANPPLNLARKLIGDSPYLDRLRMGHNQTIDVEIDGDDMTSDTRAAVLWYDAYHLV